jgi:hypothetical protein
MILFNIVSGNSQLDCMLHNKQKPSGESLSYHTEHGIMDTPLHNLVGPPTKTRPERLKATPCLGYIPRRVIVTHARSVRQLQETQVAQTRCSKRITPPWDWQWNHLTALDVCPPTLCLSPVTHVQDPRFRINTYSLERSLACSIVKKRYQTMTFGNL